MAGKIKQMIDNIVMQKSGGSDSLKGVTRSKLALKGVIPSKYDENSLDDPIIIEKLKVIAKEMNINL